MRLIDTITLVPHPYGRPDVWVSQDSANPGSGRWIELRMHSRHARRTVRFSVLYTGPHGVIHRARGNQPLTGPHGSLIPQSSVSGECIDVAEGDVLILNGQRMVIADDRPLEYPRLITETEWGVVTARNAVQTYITEIQRSSSPDDKQAAAQINTLYELHRRLDTDTDELRARFRPLPSVTITNLGTSTGTGTEKGHAE